MYLTHHELNRLLNNPCYTQPVTESHNTYKFYQGRLSTKVYTVRFNLGDMSPDLMITYLNNHLPRYFKPESKLLCCVYWDLVLRSPDETYYIYRANSNRINHDESSETTFKLTYINISRLVHHYTGINVNDLNVKFDSSNVTIDRMLTVVLSFMSM